MDSLLLPYVNLMAALVFGLVIIKIIFREIRKTLDHQESIRSAQVHELFELAEPVIRGILHRGESLNSSGEELGDLRKLYQGLEEAGREAFGYEAEVKEAKDEDEDG